MTQLFSENLHVLSNKSKKEKKRKNIYSSLSSFSTFHIAFFQLVGRPRQVQTICHIWTSARRQRSDSWRQPWNKVSYIWKRKKREKPASETRLRPCCKFRCIATKCRISRMKNAYAIGKETKKSDLIMIFWTGHINQDFIRPVRHANR